METSVPASGDHSRVEPPGPVPNPEVKRFSADGSWTTGPVRVGRRQVICPDLVKTRSGLFCAHVEGREGRLRWHTPDSEGFMRVSIDQSLN